MSMWKLLLLLLAAAAAADAHHLLCIFALPSKSHHHLGKGIVNALLKGGHEVTWVTAYPPKEVTPNLHVIDGSATLETIRDFDMNNKRKINAGFSFVRQFAYNVSRATVNIPELRKALVNGKYDAVLTETFFSDIDAGFAAVVQAPWIVLSGIVMAPTTERLVDEVKSVATIPLIFNDFPVPMNFWQRWSNLGLYYFLLFEEWWNYSITLERYSEIFAPLAAARGVTLPPLEQSLYDISILFVNSHPSFAPAQSLPPNVVDIGGYHIEETKTELPEDLKAILDASPQGVIYYSMGSVLKSASLPPASRAAVLRVLGELPYTVLWKFEEELPGVPENVHIRPWMPQPAILAHNNTKAFITHGGLLSNLEALKYGTPLIPMPVFGDQPANAARAVRAGYAATVTPFDPDNVAEPLKLAIQKTMADDKYYKRAKYLSWLFNNRPVPPAKLITHYVELAVESKGAHHLRSKAHLYSWYQRSGLDLLATIFVSLLVVYKLLKFAFCKICAKFCKTSNKKVKRN